MNLKALIPLGMFLVLAVFLAFGLTRDPSKLPSELIDRPFPNFELTTLYDAEEILTDDIMKGQVSLVNIFGSWCVACVQEHPNLMYLSKRENVRLIGVDWRDTRENAQRWLDKYDDPYNIILFDDTSQLAIDLGVTGAPETFVVDKAGNIRYKHVGIITKDVWEQTLRPLVRELENPS